MSICAVSGLFVGLLYLPLSFGALSARNPPDPSSYEATVELGAAYSGIDVGYCGYGIGISYPWYDHVLVEAAYTQYFDRDHRPRHSVFLTGMRVGIRRKKFGVFAKLQPGVFRDADTSMADPPSVIGFALLAGGVLEVFLDTRVYTRFDMDVLTIWLGDTTLRGVPVGRPGTSMYQHGSIGVGFRF